MPVREHALDTWWTRSSNGDGMGRTKKSATLDNRSNRLKLDIAIRHQTPLAGGFYLAYRRPRSGQAGAWLARWKDAGEKVDKQARLGDADDYTDADGIRILSYAQAQKKAEDWFKDAVQVLELERGGDLVPGGPYTVADARTDYLADARRRGVRGIKIMEQTANLHILPALGELHVNKLTRKRIESWHEGLSLAPRRTNRKLREGEEPQPARELTKDEIRARRDTANRILSDLKAALNYAAGQRRTAGATPWREVKPFQKTTSQRVRFMTVDEQRKLVAACDPDLRPLVMGALYTGGRYGELCKVLVRDFDPIHRTLFIQWGKGKGDAVSRSVSLSPEAVAWFTDFTRGREADELMWRRKAVARTKRAALLRDPNGWTDYDQVFAMEKAVKAAGIAAVTFHELRHTYASGLINAGVPLMFVAKQLGHSDTRMCERHYGHIARQALAASIEQLSPKLGLFEPVRGADEKAPSRRFPKSGVSRK